MNSLLQQRQDQRDANMVKRDPERFLGAYGLPGTLWRSRRDKQGKEWKSLFLVILESSEHRWS